MPRILVVNDMGEANNWGAKALTEGLFRVLKATIPGIEIQSLPTSWVEAEYARKPSWLGGEFYQRNSGTLPWYDRWGAPFDSVPWLSDDFEFCAEEWDAGKGGPMASSFIAELKKVDAVVYNAEGSTYRRNRMGMVGLFLLWYAKTRHNIPAFFLNGTIHLTDVDRILPGMARKTLPVLDGVAVREQYSHRNVMSYVPGLEVECVPDSAFWFTPEDATRETPALKEFLAGLGGRDFFVYSSSMTQSDYLRSRGRSGVFEVVKRLQEVVPCVVFAGRDSEDRYLVDLARRSGGIHFDGRFTYFELMGLLEKARFLVSGRYHNMILGSVMGCPCVPLMTGSAKNDGLCEFFGPLFGPPFDPTDFRRCGEALASRAREVNSKRDEYSRATAARAKELRSSVARLGELVAERLGLKPAAQPHAPVPQHEMAR